VHPKPMHPDRRARVTLPWPSHQPAYRDPPQPRRDVAVGLRRTCEPSWRTSRAARAVAMPTRRIWFPGVGEAPGVSSAAVPLCVTRLNVQSNAFSDRRTQTALRSQSRTGRAMPCCNAIHSNGAASSSQAATEIRVGCGTNASSAIVGTEGPRRDHCWLRAPQTRESPSCALRRPSGGP
jgi:hypothetical protein